MAKVTMQVDKLRKLSQGLLSKVGVKASDATLVTESLLDAEIRGVTSHGLMRLPSYLDRIQKGLINVDPDISMSWNGSTVLVDGKNGLGQVITMKALNACMECAKKTGVSIGMIKNSNHFGTAGYFSRAAAKQGYVAFVASNASPTMPPFGGVDTLLGTNPFAVSFPAGSYDNFTIDIAMSAVAKGKIRIYEQEGKKIPQGWAMDASGNDTTDPAKAIAGGLLPMGGHKGYGLAMVVDLLCAILSGAKLSCETESMFDAQSVAGIGHFLGVIRIDRLMPRAAFESRAEAWFNCLKASRTRPGVDNIYIPGEIENLREKELPNYLEVPDKIIEALQNWNS